MNKVSFDDTEMSKKEFYEGKKAVNLNKVDVDKIVVSIKIKGKYNKTSKIFGGYLDDIGSIVIPLCIILPQISVWIKMRAKACHLK